LRAPARPKPAAWLGRRSEKCRPVLKLLVANQPQIRLVHEAVASSVWPGFFPPSFAAPLTLAEFLVDEGQQLVGGLGIASVDGMEGDG